VYQFAKYVSFLIDLRYAPQLAFLCFKKPFDTEKDLKLLSNSGAGAIVLPSEEAFEESGNMLLSKPAQLSK